MMIADDLFIDFDAELLTSNNNVGYIYSVITGKPISDECKAKTELKAFLKQPKDAILKQINPDFPRLIRAMKTERMTEEDIRALFPGYSQDIIHIAEVYNREDRDICRPLLPLEMLYHELYTPVNPPTPKAPPKEGQITFSDQVDEAVSLILGNAFAGKTALIPLKADEYGFNKENLFKSIVISYGKQSDNAKDILRKWLADTDCFAVYDYLSFLSPSLGTIPVLFKKPSIGKYWKKALRNLLCKLEESAWYSAEELWISYRNSTAPISLLETEMQIWPFLSTKNIAGFEDGIPDNTLDTETRAKARVDELVRRPIFSGMLYTLFLLGVLDITEKIPQLTVKKSARKLVPYSPFDALDSVSVSAYGRWMLGLTEEKPEIKKEFSEPVLDRNLLIITYNGKSIELRSFLSSIADSIGPVRYKVTLRSFTQGAENREEAEERIEEFIYRFPSPPENWQKFLDSVINSYEVVKQIDQGVLLEVEDDDLMDKIISSKLARRTEGNLLYVSNRDIGKFSRFINDMGYHI